jgi:polysaccharide export outer membrane protein
MDAEPGCASISGPARLLCAAIIAVALLGCRHEVDRIEAATPITQVNLPDPPDEPPPPHVLGPGDLLAIQVNELPETAQRCRVGIDGTVRFGPCGDVPASGIGIPALTVELKDRLSRYYREPIVEIQLVATHSRHAVALGQVSKPGSINLVGGERILDLLSRCGGLARSGSSENTESLADLEGAIYVRGNRLLPVDFTALITRGVQKQNVTVHPGDFLYIPSNVDRQIFVLGAVNSPDVITMRTGFSVSRAVAAAGGPTRDAYLDRAILIRGSRSEPVAARIDLHGILEGRRPDLPLRKGDIIYIPGRTSENPRFWLDRFNDSFLATVTARYADEIYTKTFGR